MVFVLLLSALLFILFALPLHLFLLFFKLLALHFHLSTSIICSVLKLTVATTFASLLNIRSVVNCLTLILDLSGLIRHHARYGLALSTRTIRVIRDNILIYRLLTRFFEKQQRCNRKHNQCSYTYKDSYFFRLPPIHEDAVLLICCA